jgi:hypothetical protein
MRRKPPAIIRSDVGGCRATRGRRARTARGRGGRPRPLEDVAPACLDVPPGLPGSEAALSRGRIHTGYRRTSGDIGSGERVAGRPNIEDPRQRARSAANSYQVFATFLEKGRTPTPTALDTPLRARRSSGKPEFEKGAARRIQHPAKCSPANVIAVCARQDHDGCDTLPATIPTER